MIVLEKGCLGWRAIRDACAELTAPAWCTKRWTDLAQWVAQTYPSEAIGVLVYDEDDDEVAKWFTNLGVNNGGILWVKL